ncbi:MAG: cysteine desulfurase-like protein [Treponema sp.]|jgi:cysteine desulfurase family protein (TIGR01976 family)|nr:cysteine desulfurase-like protein [Treponema sp.]
MHTNFPIENVRKRFPALKRMHNGKQVVFFDGPGGSQVLDSSIEAVSGYMKSGSANRRGVFPTSQETETIIANARKDVQTLFNAQDHAVAFGPNATTMMFHASRAIARDWKEGDEIILSELEHHSNIDSWRTAAEDKNVTVKYIPLDVKSLTLDIDRLPQLITPQTKLIAVGSASNCIGTITDVKAVSVFAKKNNIPLAVDAVHAIPHLYVDVEDLGIDMLFSSAYKFFAAHVGMAVIRKSVFEKLNVYKLSAAPDEIPDRMEIGTQNHGGIASVSSAVNFIAELGTGENLSLKIISGYKAMEEHENSLAEYIRRELKKIDGITLYQADDSIPKTPTIAFRALGISPRDFCVRICEEHSVFIASGHFYAVTLVEKLGISDSGSFIRAGIAPYNTLKEAELFVSGVKAIMASL